MFYFTMLSTFLFMVIQHQTLLSTTKIMKGNLLLPLQGLFLPIGSNGSFMCTISSDGVTQVPPTSAEVTTKQSLK